MARPAGSVGLDLPSRLTDQEFWKLTEDLSEPDGTFRSENLLSNEMVFARFVPELVSRVKPGGVYMGVGPEQNFTYIAAMMARLAFITDIRRGNLHVLLMYKALFELSADRAEFISRLFTKPRPPGLSASSSVVDIMDAYWNVPSADEAAYSANLAAILRHLTKTHALPLLPEDLDGIARAYRAFYWYGPSMNYSANTALTGIGGGRAATYRDLVTQTSADGRPLSFLASDETFWYVKDLYSRNLIVPLVGDFAGPKTIRAIGEYVRSRGATVTAFYVSSVEPYLQRAGTWPTFCASVATLPMNDGSVVIRTGRIGGPPTVTRFTPTATDARGLMTILTVATPQVGSYQTGVIVPMGRACN